ncbi:MAG: hypothetical protein CM15mP83_3190 [Flavobacteriaceae bacterium]|nr:MAG: hypothetical protein CM15mP83_3190 [Flavobacteriaceae bacterium]
MACFKHLLRQPKLERPLWGDLELWPDGLKGEPIVIPSRNSTALLAMATHQGSWHAVRPVQVDQSRNCVSNYYFSPNPLRETDRFHVTTLGVGHIKKLK